MSNVRNFGAGGDGKQDETDAIQHAIDQGDGPVEFPRGDYVISRPILVDTTKKGRLAIFGSQGTAKIVMKGAGPAFRFIGSHQGTADPSSMKPEVWRSERLPMISEIEIEGQHQQADGIECIGTVQAVIRNVGMRQLRHGIRLTRRNRNVIIEGCQIYHNRGVGIFMDAVNLHQINVIGNHISYNRLGGIRIERSEVRNLQITGNDIEYNTNRTHQIKDEATAEIYIDCTAANATVNEVTIASNTIQAQPSPNGANIRIIENSKETGRPPGLYAITGNVIGSQTNNVHLTGSYGMTITGNSIYSAAEHNLLLQQCKQMTIGSNQFRRHTPTRDTGIRLEDCVDCIVNGCHVLDESNEDRDISLMHLKNCDRISITGCQLVTKQRHCLHVETSKDVVVSGSSFFNQPDRSRKPAIRWSGEGTGNLINGSRIVSVGTDATKVDEASSVLIE